MSKSDAISQWAWLWIPVFFLAAQVFLEIFLPQRSLAALLSENGPHETLEFLCMGAAFCVGIFTLKNINWATQKWLGLWLALASLCSFYVAAEEISWGQHILRWTTPDFWAQVNDQAETNLHNTSAWFDQKPRLLLQVGILFGGLVFPLLRRLRPGLLPQKFSIIYPPDILSVTALMALIVNMADRVDAALADIVLFERASEVEELYLFYFVLLYLIVLRRRVLSLKK